MGQTRQQGRKTITIKILNLLWNSLLPIIVRKCIEYVCKIEYKVYKVNKVYKIESKTKIA